MAPALFVMLVGGFTGFSDSGNDPITPKMVVARQVLVTVPLPLAAVVVGVTIWLGVLRKTAVWVPLVGLGLMIALLVWHRSTRTGRDRLSVRADPGSVPATPAEAWTIEQTL